MKILLLGANGQVGHELRRSLAGFGTVVAATRSGVLPDGAPCEAADFDQPDSLRGLLERTTPDRIVNAAAYTAVDRAEDEVEATLPVIKKVMEGSAMPAVALKVPLQVDARAADNWDEAH